MTGITMGDALHVLIGGLIVAAVLLDVFLTVLFPGSGHGPIRKPLDRTVWLGFRLVGRVLPRRMRPNLLSYSGPVLISLTMLTWFALLAVGWAVIFKPALGTGIQASSGPTDTGWSTALYYSGFNLTTLGVGDLAPKTAVWRILTVVEAALGFTFFSMAVTYFLSVYSGIARRNALALGLHHLTGCTGDAAVLIARLSHGSSGEALPQHLSSTAEGLRQIYQTHRLYPVLRYFHFRQHFYAVPHVLLLVLDAVTILRTALSPARHSVAMNSPVADDLFETAFALADEILAGLPQDRDPTGDMRVWRARYEAALDRLAGAGLTVRSDREAGFQDYARLRTRWDRPVHDLADELLYEWDHIDGTARNPGQERVG